MQPGTTQLTRILPSAAACCLLALAEGRMRIPGTQKNNASSAGQWMLPIHVLLPCLLLPAGRSAFLPDMSGLQMGFFKCCNTQEEISFPTLLEDKVIYNTGKQVIRQNFSDFFFPSEKHKFMRRAYGIAYYMIAMHFKVIQNSILVEGWGALTGKT